MFQFTTREVVPIVAWAPAQTLDFAVKSWENDAGPVTAIVADDVDPPAVMESVANPTVALHTPQDAEFAVTAPVAGKVEQGR